ncbi:MAG: hypothetical protein WBS19_03690 [Candidatus Korobacteraceae bacterium]
MPVKTQRDFDAARERYRPAHIKTLFIAEAPPALDSKRFFYFENVTSHDALFWETMRVLYKGTELERSRKTEFLNRFKADGFFLIDACRLPIPEDVNKYQEIRKSLEDLKSRVADLVEPDAKIILICKTVYDECFSALRARFNVINEEMIPHPAMGHQRDFRNKLGKVITHE